MNKLEIDYKKINIILEYKIGESEKLINKYIEENINLFDYIDILNDYDKKKFYKKYNTFDKKNIYNNLKKDKNSNFSNNLISILTKMNFDTSYNNNNKQKLFIIDIYGRRKRFFISDIINALQLYSNTPKTVIIVTNNIHNINNRFLYTKKLIVNSYYITKKYIILDKFNKLKFIFFQGIDHFILNNLTITI